MKFNLSNLKIFYLYNFDSQLVKIIREVSIDIFGKVRKNIFFDILLWQAACSILLAVRGRRSAVGFSAFGFIPDRPVH